MVGYELVTKVSKAVCAWHPLAGILDEFHSDSARLCDRGLLIVRGKVEKGGCSNDEAQQDTWGAGSKAYRRHSRRVEARQRGPICSHASKARLSVFIR